MYVIECPYATTSDFGSSTVAMSIRISSIAADLFALVVTLRQTHMAFDLRRRTITQILLVDGESATCNTKDRHALSHADGAAL